MRSLAFNVLFYATSALFVFAIAPICLIPGQTAGRLARAMIRLYARTMRALMAHVAGIRVEVRGRERLTSGRPVIIAAKHQSYGDGFTPVAVLDDIAFVTGDHLERFPLVGPVLKKVGAIVVDNCGGHQSRKRLADSFEAAAAEGRSVLIYPEGRLVKIGEESVWKSGVWHMQQASGWDVVPVATNLGLFWSCQDWAKTKGVATIEFLDPIPAGLPKDEFLARLQRVTEGHTAKLVAEARVRQPELAAVTHGKALAV
jgi:1-acyl-sn-glycerol-3-phosphate acyltransferase